MSTNNNSLVSNDIKYAFVFVIWGGLKYLTGAITCAYSLIQQNTTHDIILMYTDIENINIKLCENIFTKVIKTELIPKYSFIQPKTNTQKSFYAGNFYNTVNTKWRCLELEEYEKVCFVDSDMIFIHNPDDVFKYPTPAAVFKNPFQEPYAGNRGLYNPYKKLLDGDLIKNETIYLALNPKQDCHSTTVANGFLVVLTPSKKQFQNLIKLFESKKRENKNYGFKNSYSSIDEQAITHLYNSQGINWYNIEPHYAMTPWKTNAFYGFTQFNITNHKFTDMIGLHYIHDKPWENGRGTGYDDTSLWWNVYFNLCTFLGDDYSDILNTQIDKTIIDSGYRYVLNNKQMILDSQNVILRYANTI